MKYYVGYAFLLLFAFVAYSFSLGKNPETITPSKNIISQEFPVSKFYKLSVSSAIVVNYTQSTGATKVVAKGPDNLIELLEISSKNSELSIGYKKNTSISNSKGNDGRVVIEIEGSPLNDIVLHGASKFWANSLNISDFSLNISGAATFKVEALAAYKAGIVMSGASTVDLPSAQIMTGTVDISGASKLKVKNYNGKSCSIVESGASTVDIAGTVESLDLVASGASKANLDDLEAATGTVDLSGASKAHTNIKKLQNIKTNGYSNVNNKTKDKEKDKEKTK